MNSSNLTPMPSLNTERRRALIISVSQYTSDLPNLIWVDEDGQKMVSLLDSQKYQIVKYIGKVNSKDIKTSINNFFYDQNIRSYDTLFFYFSGHVVPTSDGQHFLASSDIDPQNPFLEGFSFDDLEKHIKNSNSNKIVIVLDCCFSGILGVGNEENNARNASSVIKTEKFGFEGKSYFLLASSMPYQESNIGNDLNHSRFTYFLIEGFRNENRYVDSNGCVTAKLLGKYVYDKLIDFNIDKIDKDKSSIQKPIIKKPDGIDDIILTIPDQKQKSKVSESFVMSNKGIGYLKLQKYEWAVNYFNEALKLNPNNVDALTNKGISLRNQERYEEAKKCFNEALRLDPKNASLWNNKGHAMMNISTINYGKNLSLLNFEKNMQTYDKHNEAIKKAIKCFDIALRLDPNNVDALTNKANAFLTSSQLNDAIKWFNEALRLDPNNSEAKMKMAFIFSQTGEIEKSLNILDEMYQADPTNAGIFAFAGKVLIQDKRFDEGIDCLDEALRLDPDNPDNWMITSMKWGAQIASGIKKITG